MAYRQIDCRVWFDWGIDGSYTNESANLYRCSGDTSLHPPEAFISGSQGIVDRASIELRNAGGRYSALNANSPLRTPTDYIGDGKAYHVPVYIETTINGGSSWQRVFTGITQIPKATGRTHRDMPLMRFECRSRDEVLRQSRTSTPQVEFNLRANGADTEADVIRKFLQNAGLTEGVHFTVDKGFMPIQWAWMDDESPLEDIWKLAAAAGGRFYCDADGIFRYENMTRWLKAPHTVSQESYTNHDWKGYEDWYEDDEIFNVVTVEYSGRLIDDSAVIWEPDEVVTAPANSTKKMTATFSSPVYEGQTITYRAATSGGLDMSAYVTVTPTWYAQRAVLTIINTHPTRAATIYPLELSGSIASGGPTTDETRNSAEHGVNNSFFTLRGSRTRSVRGNVYIQSRVQAQMLAQFLLDRHEKPRVFYKLNGVLANGARRPGDRITINEASTMSSARTAMITAIRWEYGERSYTMSIDALDTGNLYPYMGASPGYFIVGGAGVGNQMGAAHANRGLLFY